MIFRFISFHTSRFFVSGLVTIIYEREDFIEPEMKDIENLRELR